MTDRHDPIVPHVLYVADQHHPWRLAAFERLRARYHTPTTVAVEFGSIDFTVQPVNGKQGATKQQTKVYCLRDDLAWDRVQGRRAALQEALDALADGLRALGSYARRLEAAGGMKQAPNPLSPTVITMPDPDTTEDGYFISNLVPRIGREEITSHTPKMLHVVRNGKPWSTTHQRDHFVCPSEDDWQRLVALRSAVKEQAEAWQRLLRELGTYQAALADGRYGESKRQKDKGTREEPMPTQAPTPPTATDFWQALSHAHPTAHHWHHEGGDTYRSACGIRSRHHPVGKRDVGHCSRCTAAIGQPTARQVGGLASEALSVEYIHSQAMENTQLAESIQNGWLVLKAAHLETAPISA
jgi:hypothetical protein